MSETLVIIYTIVIVITCQHTHTHTDTNTLFSPDCLICKVPGFPIPSSTKRDASVEADLRTPRRSHAVCVTHTHTVHISTHTHKIWGFVTLEKWYSVIWS